MTEANRTPVEIDISTPANPDARAIIDAADLDLVAPYKWSVNGKYACHYRRNAPNLYMHRLIMGADAGQQVDHINHNTLDNRRENLRLCTNAQNQMNTRPNAGRRYKGVYKHAKGGWQAIIRINSRNAYLGLYQTEEAAARAYDAAARTIFGDFALPNFPDSPALPEILKAWADQHLC